MNSQDVEQMQAGMRDLAKLLHEHFLRLVAQGFTREEALQFTLAFQHTMLSSGMSK